MDSQIDSARLRANVRAIAFTPLQVPYETGTSLALMLDSLVRVTGQCAKKIDFHLSNKTLVQPNIHEATYRPAPTDTTGHVCHFS